MLAALIIFVAIFSITALAIGFGQVYAENRQKQQVREMFHATKAQPATPRIQLLRPEATADPLRHYLNQFTIFARLENLIEQAGKDWTSSKFLFSSLVCGLIGLAIGLYLPLAMLGKMPAIVLFLAGSSLPFVSLLRARKKRVAEFEELFPEALDFLSRSMRAGHGFSIGLEMLVADSSEPLRSSFRRVLHDINLGSSLDTALNKLVLLVPLIDVRFFVSAVLLQQETGGNLSEVLNNMSTIIRDRFRLKGQVKAHSAHGKITGLVLAVMPLVVAGILFVISPEYLLVLTTNPIGRYLLIGSVIGQVLGYVCIKKIVDIKV
jgi:tight adherence protein B